MDRSLRQVRFAPRPSLEAELLSRLRSDRTEASNGLSSAGLPLVAAVLAGTLVFLFRVKLLTVAAGGR
ncbi:MAG TPA: hypothetical protein VHG35_06590 [Gemmatimonadales bacterium]|nr:hypothetical protein [Gemmatimonadales bacterium]